METIHIYHTNDFHSHLEHWPRILQFLEQQQADHAQQGEDVFRFDIGDFIDRWHPYTEASMGKGNIELLNKADYKAVTIGNNEGVNLSFDDLDHLYDKAAFDVLAANLYLANGVYPNWVKPYKIYQTDRGTRIGVIGLTAAFTHLYELLGWKVTEPVSELKKWIEPLRQNADIVVLLSHLGIEDDERIAAAFPEIDVILGAHTHHFFKTGKQVDDTLIGAAGKFGHYVGHVTITVNEQKVIERKKAVLYDFHDLPPVDDEQEQVEAFFKKGKAGLSQKIATLTDPLVNNPFAETNFSRLLCKTVREWCRTDCAMINAGLLLGDLEGEITEYDLLSICPHPINPCVVELTGWELQKVLFEAQDKEFPHRIIKGLGFRGTVLGIFVFDGILFERDTIFIGDREMELENSYTLALPDMFTFGHFFKEVLPHKPKEYILPEFLRDLLKWKLQMLS